MESSVRRGGLRKTGILHPGQKSVVESDAYGGPKCGSKICINDNEATYGMRYTSQRMWFKNVASKIIVDDKLLYGHTDEQLLAYFRTVLDALRHHCAKINLKTRKWFQERCKLVGMDVAAGGTQPA